MGFSNSLGHDVVLDRKVKICHQGVPSMLLAEEAKQSLNGQKTTTLNSSLQKLHSLIPKALRSRPRLCLISQHSFS